DPDCHHRRLAVWRGADGIDHHRDDLRVARRRAAADHRHQHARLSTGAGVHPVDCGDLRGRQLGYRPAIWLARSEDSLRMMLRVGVLLVTLAVLAALTAPLLAPHDPAIQELPHRLEGPTLSHPFGLDELGRDVLSRILFGARVSLLVGLSV